MTIKNIKTRSKLDLAVTLDDVFPIHSYCYLLDPKYYGCMGFIVSTALIFDLSNGQFVAVGIIKYLKSSHHYPYTRAYPTETSGPLKFILTF